MVAIVKHNEAITEAERAEITGAIGDEVHKVGIKDGIGDDVTAEVECSDSMSKAAADAQELNDEHPHTSPPPAVAQGYGASPPPAMGFGAFSPPVGAGRRGWAWATAASCSHSGTRGSGRGRAGCAAARATRRAA